MIPNNRKVKTNSFSGNPSIQQIISYLIYFTVTLSDILIGTHFFKNEERTLLLVFYCFILLLSIISSIKCSLIDPTDNIIYLQRKMKKNNLYFNYIDHQLDYYCDNCNAFVTNNSKHCGYCNRCTSKFDHHCKWINNCIGGANYFWFIRMITFVLFQAFISLVLNSINIGRYKANELSFNDSSVIVFQGEQKGDFKQKIIIISCVLGLDCLIILMLFQLLIFHIYLIITNQTTYEFLILKKNNTKVVVPTKDLQITDENRQNQHNIVMEVPIDNKPDQDDTINQDQRQQEHSKSSSNSRVIRPEPNQASMEVLVQNNMIPQEEDNFIKKSNLRKIQSQIVDISFHNHSMEEKQNPNQQQITSQNFFSQNYDNQRVRKQKRLQKLDFDSLRKQ